MVVSHDWNPGTGVKQRQDAALVIIDGRPIPLSTVRLVNGVFVDEDGRPTAAVKAQTWY